MAQSVPSWRRNAIVSSSNPRSGFDRYFLTWRPYCPCELGMGGLGVQIGLPAGSDSAAIALLMHFQVSRGRRGGLWRRPYLRICPVSKGIVRMCNELVPFPCRSSATFNKPLINHSSSDLENEKSIKSDDILRRTICS